MNWDSSNIWLVDDDEGEHEIFKKTLKEINPSIALSHFYNGDQVLHMLTQFIPDMLFLDLYMPYDGMSCLKTIRERKKLDAMPVIIYTTSNNNLEIQISYGYGATIFMQKPTDPYKLKKELLGFFAMNWDQPKEITKSHFHNNRYIPFYTNRFAQND